MHANVTPGLLRSYGCASQWPVAMVSVQILSDACTEAGVEEGAVALVTKRGISHKTRQERVVKLVQPATG